MIKLKDILNERINLDYVRDKLENEYDWTYVEREGKFTVRFDYRNNSMWVNSDGTISGTAPRDAGLKRAMKKLGITEGKVNEALNKSDVKYAMKMAFDNVPGNWHKALKAVNMVTEL